MHLASISAAVHWWVDAHFCKAALSSGVCILPEAILQYIGGGSLHTCVKSISS